MSELLQFSQHARVQWSSRFKKLKRDRIMVREASRATLLGTVSGSEYYRTPCGAILVVADDTIKTVLLGRYLSDQLHQALRSY